MSALDAYRRAAFAGRTAAQSVGMRPNVVTVRVETWSGGAIGLGTVTYSDTVLTPHPRVNKTSERGSYYGAGVQDASTGLLTAARYTVGPITGAFTSGGTSGGYTPAQLAPAVAQGQGQRVVYLIDGDEFGTTGQTFRLVEMDASQPIHTTLILEQVAPSETDTGFATLSGTVVNLDTGLPMEGVTVGIVGDSGTVATDADGAWTLETLGSRDVTVRYLEATIYPTQTTYTVGTTDLAGLDAYLVPATFYADVIAAVGVTDNPADGSVFALYSPPETTPAGFGVTLTPSSGTWIAPDPPTLSTTTILDVGVLFVANVTPGTVTMAPTAPVGHTAALAAHVASSQVVTAAVMTYLPSDWT